MNRRGLVPRSSFSSEVGFTLIEILVTIGLIILLLALVGYPILTGFAFMEKGVARADAQSAARLAMDAMTRELAEAMYVFDPPLGGMFAAFLPARSSAPGASPGEQAAPIEPGAVAIRYWRALRDPLYAYAPFYQLGANPVNPYYLARTEIALPTARDDPWNDSDEALTRAIFWYPDGHSYGGQAWPTAQPGYPWLEAVRQYGAGPPPPPAAYDLYRQLAVGLTPNNADYDIPSAGFSPARITEETLIPWTSAFPRDCSRYRARYPLWADFAQWDPQASDFAMMGQIKVYMGSPRTLTYITGVDETTGEVWVARAGDGARLYDIGSYPQRDVTDPDQAEFAFGIDYDRGEVLFDFPAQDQIAASAAMYIYDLPSVSSLPATAPDSRSVVRGSTTVWVSDSSGGVIYYQAVEPMPANPSSIGANRYALHGLQLVFDSDSGQHPGDGDVIQVRYRYRNNPEDELVVATYATKAIINIALTVSKRDLAARSPEASRQDVTLVAKVKLKNVSR